MFNALQFEIKLFTVLVDDVDIMMLYKHFYTSLPICTKQHLA